MTVLNAIFYAIITGIIAVGAYNVFLPIMGNVQANSITGEINNLAAALRTGYRTGNLKTAADRKDISKIYYLLTDWTCNEEDIQQNNASYTDNDCKTGDRLDGTTGLKAITMHGDNPSGGFIYNTKKDDTCQMVKLKLEQNNRNLFSIDPNSCGTALPNSVKIMMY